MGLMPCVVQCAKNYDKAHRISRSWRLEAWLHRLIHSTAASIRMKRSVRLSKRLSEEALTWLHIAIRPKLSKRSAMLGVRSIEHATLIDKETAGIVADKGAFAVPTVAIVSGSVEEGEKLGFPAVSMEKLRRIADRALAGLEIMKEAGVKMGFGTDLLGPLHVRQSQEFTLRAQVLAPIDILRSACSINADLMGQSGEIGCVRKGALADLLVIDGNPLEDISLLAGSEQIKVIMKDGQFHKRTI